MKADKIPVSKAMSVARPSHTLATPSFDFAAPNAASSFNIPRIHYSLDNVQLSAADVDTGLSTEQVGEIAANGINGTPMPLPYFNRVQQAFGKHDISHVQAYADGKAAQAAKSIGAEAYASGDKIAFANANPSLHTVAHEAAHIIQQQAGVHLKGGVGQEGDRYEQHADAVADAVVTGKSAENLLTQVTILPQQSTKRLQAKKQGQPVQRKLEFKEEDIKKAIDLADNSKSFKKFKKKRILETALENLQRIDHTVDLNTVSKYIEELSNDHYHTHIIADHSYENCIKRLSAYLTERHAAKKLNSKDELAFAMFLNDLQIKDETTPTRTDLQTIENFREENSYRLIKYMDLFPGGKKKETSQDVYLPSYDLDSFKTELNKSDIKKSGYDVGYGAYLLDKHGLVSNTAKLRTKVTWSKAESSVFGTKMVANPLGPDHKLGTTPAKSGGHITARKALTEISSDKYIAGHLLNEQLGGPGNDVRNLAPIPDYANKIHEKKVENEIKYLVNIEHLWIWYQVEAPTASINKTKYDALLEKLKKGDKDEVSKAEKIEKAYKDVEGKYTKSFIMEWGLLDEDGEKLDGNTTSKTSSTDKMPDTKRELTLNFPDPIDLYQYVNSGFDDIPMSTEEVNISGAMSGIHANIAENLEKEKATNDSIKITRLLTSLLDLDMIDLVQLIKDDSSVKVNAINMFIKLSDTDIEALFLPKLNWCTNLVRLAAADISSALTASTLKTHFTSKTALLRKLFTSKQLLQLFRYQDLCGLFGKVIADNIAIEGLYGSKESHKATNEKLNRDYIRSTLPKQLAKHDLLLAKTQVNFKNYEFLLIKEEKVKAQLGSVDVFLPIINDLQGSNDILQAVIADDIATTLDLEKDKEFIDWSKNCDIKIENFKKKAFEILYYNSAISVEIEIDSVKKEINNVPLSLIQGLQQKMYNEIKKQHNLDAPNKYDIDKLNKALKAYFEKYAKELVNLKKLTKLQKIDSILIDLTQQQKKRNRNMSDTLKQTLLFYKDKIKDLLLHYLEKSDSGIFNEINLLIDFDINNLDKDEEMLQSKFYEAVASDTRLSAVFSTRDNSKAKRHDF